MVKLLHILLIVAFSLGQGAMGAAAGGDLASAGGAGHAHHGSDDPGQPHGGMDHQGVANHCSAASCSFGFGVRTDDAAQPHPRLALYHWPFGDGQRLTSALLKIDPPVPRPQV